MLLSTATPSLLGLGVLGGETSSPDPTNHVVVDVCRMLAQRRAWLPPTQEAQTQENPTFAPTARTQRLHLWACKPRLCFTLQVFLCETWRQDTAEPTLNNSHVSVLLHPCLRRGRRTHPPHAQTPLLSFDTTPSASAKVNAQPARCPSRDGLLANPRSIPPETNCSSTIAILWRL